MQQKILLLILLGINLLLIGELTAAPFSLSPQGGFSLNAENSPLSRQFSRRLTEFEKRFSTLTAFPDTDAPPVVLVLHTHEGDFRHPVSLRMDALEGSTPRIQVDLSKESLNSPLVSTTLAQALLLRVYYDGKSPPPGYPIAEFPSWLLHGLGRLCDPQAKLTVIPLAYVRGATPPSIADLLVQKMPPDMNPVISDVYDTMSGELLNAGLEGEGGVAALREWIGKFHPESPGKERSSWPAGWGMQSVERRWLLLMAGKSGQEPGVSTLLGVEETLGKYDDILRDIPTPDHSLALLKGQKGAVFLVQQLEGRLVSLRLEAHPLTSPLLDDSIHLCGSFKKLPVKKIAAKEKDLLAMKEKIQKRSREIESYLDWFEAAKTPVKSGLFDDFLNTPEEPLQKGPLGRYLDTVEQRGW